MSIREEARQLQDQIVDWRRMFHQCPELKMDTPVTSGKIIDILREIGIEEIRTQIGGNGVAAVIRGAHPGKCLGIRADCDGLPIREETGLPFASVNGNMHACGHDAHTAMALGAAKLLYQHRHELHGCVKMIFQPYEEGGQGARMMVEDGVMENPHVDAMIALHTGLVGQVGTLSGDLSWHPQVSSFSTSQFSIRVKGKNSHAAQPHEGVDALLAACHIVTALQSLLSRERDPAEQVILSVNVMRSGVRHNVIPDEAYMEGTLRTMLNEDTDAYFERITQLCQGIAAAMRCTVEVERMGHMPAIRNHPDMTKVLLRVAPDIVGQEHVIEVKKMVAAGEDFPVYSELVPSLYFFLSAARGGGLDYPHHNPKFDIDESNLWEGTGVFTAFALDWQA